MSILDLFALAVGLSMDAFAVAICKGLSMDRVTLKKAVIVGLYFGFFQAAMPLAGYFLGAGFADSIGAFDHWIAFALLGFLGVRMIMSAVKKDDDAVFDPNEGSVSFKNMFPLAIATSIDALAAGVSFAFLKIDIVPAVSFIGVVTLILSVAGVKIGSVFGLKFKSKAELAGGVILILMGIKILLES